MRTRLWEDEREFAAERRSALAEPLHPHERVLELQRAAGNRAVSGLMRQGLDGQAAGGQAAAPPLLLTDRPWEEIERERANRPWQGILPGTRPRPAGGLGLPFDRPFAIEDLLVQEADEEPEEAQEPTGPVLMLTDRSHRQIEHERRGRQAKERKERRRQARAAKVERQRKAPRSTDPQAPDALKTALAQAEGERQSRTDAMERGLAGEAVAKARGRIPALRNRLAGMLQKAAAPDAATASFMTAAQVTDVTNDRQGAQAQDTAVLNHDNLLAAQATALGTAGAATQPAHAAAGQAFDLGDLEARIRGHWATHLSPQAVSAKVDALLDGARTDPLRKLGRTAANAIKRTSAGKTKTVIEAEIAQAVQRQHNPRLGIWLDMLQVTQVVSGGKLRIKRLTKRVGGGMNQKEYPVHLSVYLDSTNPPANGVNSTLDQATDAVLAPGAPTGAHLTLEFKGQIAPRDNPHYYRGEPTAVRHSFDDNAAWPKVQTGLIQLMTETVDELKVRIQGFLDRKGRDPSDV